MQNLRKQATDSYELVIKLAGLGKLSGKQLISII